MRRALRRQKHRLRDFAATTVPAAPFRNMPLDRWPGWLGKLFGLKVPRGITPQPAPSPAGSANINIVLNLAAEALEVEGAFAECGVFRGETILPLGLFLQQRGANKQIFGFDSFEGFDEDVKIDQAIGGAPIPQKKIGGFDTTSQEVLSKKIKNWNLENRITLVKGYFKNTLNKHEDQRFSFVHLDCDLYESYRVCLEFFYPRLSPGGLILFDEYNDPPWPGCNKAVDEFLADKPESPELRESDNFQKWFFRKGGK